ncbi:MAG: glycosyltransferase family 2 protein [Elusimicrobia bacterium]|nr:glycosyltransferase family 2 protein [Elusimicrobiota bacterium]
MNNTDLISVILPTYNRAHLIKRSVESILNQTYQNIELIIIDDGSTDNTKEVIESLNDKRIVYIYQKNQGCCAARNKGIEVARGNYIALQDSDDAWHPDKLEIQINALKENNADVVFCKVFTIGNLIKRIAPKIFKEGFLKEDMLPINIWPQSLLGKAEVFKHNLFNPNIPTSEEIEILLRIQQKHSIYCIDKPLFDYYIQKDSLSINPENKTKALEYILKTYSNILKKYSNYYLEIMLGQELTFVSKIRDKEKRKFLLNLIFEIDNSNKLKIIYLCHRLHLYEIRRLMYNSISIPLKNIIKLFK